MLKIPTPVHPPVSRENYVLHQIEQAFPGGEWVDEPQEEEAEVAEVPGCEPGGRGFESLTPLSKFVTVIGDTKDTPALLEAVAGREVILGRLPSGRGAEAKVAALLKEHGVPVQVVEADVDRFGAKANDVHVEQVLTVDLDSPLIILGNGARAKQAKSWVARASWPREVVTL